jgi:hypothetical protein
MGSDTDEYYGGERPGRKPSLQARLQSGMYVHRSVQQSSLIFNLFPHSLYSDQCSGQKQKCRKILFSLKREIAVQQ